MGCGKSKPLDVATGNTLIQKSKSSVNSKENGVETETKGAGNNNVENQSFEAEKKSDGNVKEIGAEGKADESNVVEGKDSEKTNEALTEKSQEANAKEIVVAEEPSENKNDQEVTNDASAAAEDKQPEEEKKTENEKG